MPLISVTKFKLQSLDEADAMPDCIKPYLITQGERFALAAGKNKALDTVLEEFKHRALPLLEFAENKEITLTITIRQ